MKNKNLCTVFIFIMLAVFTVGLYAQEQGKNNQLSFGTSCLVALSDKTLSIGPGLQVSWLAPGFFTDFLGLGIHVGLIMPIGQEIGYGVTLIAGPGMTIFDNSKFRIPVTLGMHINYAFIQLPEFWVWNFGIGAVSDFVWQFGRKWYAYGRVQAVLNIGSFEFLATPGLGLGLSF